MAISSPGIGSNLDVNSIVTQLMTIESQPLVNLNQKEASYQAKLTAFGSLKGALSSFQSAISSLNSPSKFNALSSSIGDSTVATVSTSSVASSGSYSLEVTQLARAQSLSSGAFANVTDTVGTGSLTIQYYDTTAGQVNSSKAAITVSIDAAHSTLGGVRDAINAANAGVTATIVNDGTGNRLVLSSNATGTANSLKITVSGDGDGNNTDNSGLSQLVYDPAGVKNLTQNQPPLDALLKVNGLSITKSSNTVTDAIQGVTLNLLKTNTGSPTNVSVTRDTNSITSAVQSFVKAYNDLNKTIADMTAYDPKTKQAGILQGDATVRTIQRQVRAMLNTSIKGLDGNMTNLSAIGVSFQKDGTLSLDTTKLQAAITANPDNIGGFFAALGKPSDSLVNYVSSTANSQPGTYALNITRIASQGTAVGSAANIHGYAVGASSLGAATTIGNPNKTLSLTVDGQAVTVTLTAGSYTPAALATEVQTQVNAALTGGRAVTADATNNILTLSSNSVGASSAISAIGGDVSSIIFGGTATTTTGVRIVAGTNDALSLSVDGVAASVALTAGVYSTSALVAELQSKINGVSAYSSAGISVSATYSAGAFTLTSNRYGSASLVKNIGGNAAVSVMGSTPVSTDGNDVAGTINGMAASGSGQYLTGSGGAVDGLKVQITGGSIGSRGTVTFSQGYAYQLDNLITDMLGSKGPLTSRTDGINRSIDDIGTQRTRLQSRLTDIEARYRKQFTALDQMIGTMKQTSDYLSQQLANLPKITG